MSNKYAVNAIFASTYGGLLPEVPSWVRKGIGRRVTTGKLVLISAVCPDYERNEKGLTYRSVGRGVPHIARQHLLLARELRTTLCASGVELEYHVTLADTEFDLPEVMQRMTGGDAEEFLARCEASCGAIEAAAEEMELPIHSCRRFTAAFPHWFDAYHAAFDLVEQEVANDGAVRFNLETNLTKRLPLYRAMTGHDVTLDYCRQVAKRQWAQYMAWGRLAEDVFGPGLVLTNHTTPNLGRVNHIFARQGKERIPILELSLTTMPA